MYYDLEGLEGYLYEIIKNYMEFGVIDFDEDSDRFEGLVINVSILSELKVKDKNQSQKLSTLYEDDIKNNLLVENISKIEKYVNKQVDNKKMIEVLLTSYQTTCFLIAKQIFEKKE